MISKFVSHRTRQEREILPFLHCLSSFIHRGIWKSSYSMVIGTTESSLTSIAARRGAVSGDNNNGMSTMD